MVRRPVVYEQWTYSYVHRSVRYDFARRGRGAAHTKLNFSTTTSKAPLKQPYPCELYLLILVDCDGHLFILLYIKKSIILHY